MAQLWKKDDPLTTADFANRPANRDAQEAAGDAGADRGMFSSERPKPVQRADRLSDDRVDDPVRDRVRDDRIDPAIDPGVDPGIDSVRGRGNDRIIDGRVIDARLREDSEDTQQARKGEFVPASSMTPESRGAGVSSSASAVQNNAVQGMPAAGANTPLLSDTEVNELRSRWSNIQAGFVDEPRRSVEQADELVATAMQRLAEGFASERATLEHQWDSGDNVSTEDLRLALQRYRTFFGRLLNAA